MKSRRKRHQKYNNTKVIRDGITFDSKKELRMYLVLREWQEQGRIKDLKCHAVYELQPRFELVKRGLTRINRPITYLPDFVFYDNEEQRVRILDAKGARTEVYKVKKKLFEWKFKEQGLYLENTL